MKQQMRRHFKLGSILTICSFIAYSCANMAAPTGGDYDYDPPVVVRTFPKANATNVTTTRIQIEFDENIVLVKQSEKVIVTPPQQVPPLIRSANQKLSVVLNDTLIPNTTYTIDFTDAITDNNESNVLENYSFTFSTGDVIDSLAVSGTILTADNLEPVKGMYVGLHSNLDDTAFTKTRFLRISRTDDRGRFTIRGIAPGRYKIYGLDDLNRDYKYDNPGEAIAFLDTVISPTTMRDTRDDTITTVIGQLSIDSVKTIAYTRFIPDDIVLRSFKSDFQRKYLAKSERVDNKLTMYFGAPTEEPILTPLNFELEDWAIKEKSLNNDTITYWIKDKGISEMDTLRMQLSYLKTDTTNLDITAIDTIRFIDRGLATKRKQAERAARRKKKEEKEPEVKNLDIKTNLSPTWDVYAKINFEFDEPINKADLDTALHFEAFIDSVYKPLQHNLIADSLNPRKFQLVRKWKYGEEYRVYIDSAAITSIYGLKNKKIETKFTVKKEDEYGNLGFYLTGIDPDVPAFVELLNSAEGVVKTAQVRKMSAIFKDVNPGKYYIRIVIDKNGNGKWDTGNYEAKRLPEVVSYFSKEIEMKPFRDVTEDWAVDTLKLVKQKPLEITKNKPEDEDAKKKKMQDRDDQRQRQDKQRERNQDRALGNDPNNRNNPNGGRRR